MKKINAVLAAAMAVGLMAQAARAQSTELKSTLKDDLFAGTEIFAKNATDVTEISMDPDSLDRVGGNRAPRARTELLHVVRSYEYDKPGMYNMADVDKFREKLDTGDWHCSVHERHLKSGESTDVCAKHRTDDLKETAIITVEPKELTFIHMIVKRDANDHSEVGGLWMTPMAGLTSLAALDPEMLEMKAQLNSLKYGLGYGAGYSHSYSVGPAGMPMNFDISVAPQIDAEAIRLSVEKSLKVKDKVMFKRDGKDTVVITPDPQIVPDVHFAPDAPNVEIVPVPVEAPAPVPAPAPVAVPAPVPAPAPQAQPAPLPQ